MRSMNHLRSHLTKFQCKSIENNLIKSLNALNINTITTTRAYTSTCYNYSSAEIEIPSNLKLATTKVIANDAIPSDPLPAERYYFPELASLIPKEAPIISLKDPNLVTNNFVDLHPTIFGVAIRKDIVLDVVRYHRHKVRQPQKTKRIWELSGSNKKPHPQKGQGRAQVGHRRNAIWRGGEKPHGPVLRDFSIKLPRKKRALGMMIALVSKFREGNLHIIDSFESNTISTSHVINQLKQHEFYETSYVLGTTNENKMNRILFLDTEINDNFHKSITNVRQYTLSLIEGITIIDVVKNDKILITPDALELWQEMLLEEYNHPQRRKALLNGLNEMKQVIES